MNGHPSRRRPAVMLALAVGLVVALGVGTLLPHVAATTRQAATNPPRKNASLPPDVRATRLLARMTLDDKIAMLHGVAGSPYVGKIPANRRLGIPALKLEDGPAGVGDGMTQVTQLPAPIAGAATWDPSLMQRYGAVIGAEEWAKGANVDLGPTVNIIRDPRWGRAFEAMGEDPYLAGALAGAEIKGVQSQGVLAQVKHVAVYNQETNRNTPADNAIIDERTLEEIYLPQFQAAVNAGVASAMCAYSTINGSYACQNQPLIRRILDQQFGFPGFVTSDWFAVHSTVGAANAGLDMEMPTGLFFGDALKHAVTSGAVSIATIDNAVRRILTEMFRFGLFDRHRGGMPSSVATSPAHARVARDVAEQGTVLLKNSNRILPLDPSRLKSITVIGESGGPSQ